MVTSAGRPAPRFEMTFDIESQMGRFIEKRDETAEAGRELPPESVVSGRRIEELA